MLPALCGFVCFQRIEGNPRNVLLRQPAIEFRAQSLLNGSVFNLAVEIRLFRRVGRLVVEFFCRMAEGHRKWILSSSVSVECGESMHHALVDHRSVMTRWRTNASWYPMNQSTLPRCLSLCIRRFPSAVYQHGGE